MYRRQSMAQRVLDLVRYRLRNRGDDPCGPSALAHEVASAALDLDASDMETTTALAYVVFALRDEREVQGKSWPSTRHHARRAVSVALAYAETHEKGCIVNAVA